MIIQGHTTIICIDHMTHQQFRWSILGILWCLFLSNLTEVPDVETTVGPTGSQDGLIVRGPLYLVCGGRKREEGGEKEIERGGGGRGREEERERRSGEGGRESSLDCLLNRNLTTTQSAHKTMYILSSSYLEYLIFVRLERV